MALGDDLRKKFWDWMGEMTSSKPMTAEAREKYRSEKALERAKKYIENLDSINGILSDIEKFGSDDLKASGLGVAIRRGSNILKKYQFATELGYEAAVAAQELHVALQEMSVQANNRCKEDFGADEDQVTICLAKYDGQWQQINVKAVLNINDPESWIRKVWVRWGKDTGSSYLGISIG